MVSKVHRGELGEPLPRNMERRQRWEELKADPEALLDHIVELVSTGGSMMEYAKKHDIPYSTLNEWIKRNPNYNARYAAARINRAEWHVQDIENLMDEVRQDKLDPAKARVIAENKRWVASRMDPHLWGDKIEVNANVNVGERYLDAIKGLVIDAEFHEVNDDND